MDGAAALVAVTERMVVEGGAIMTMTVVEIVEGEVAEEGR
jgi:hypothetical protein